MAQMAQSPLKEIPISNSTTIDKDKLTETSMEENPSSDNVVTEDD